MAYTTSEKPAEGQRHEVIITVDGPIKDEKAWKAFLDCIKKCVDDLRGSSKEAGIGIRGLVDAKTGRYIYPSKPNP